MSSEGDTEKSGSIRYVKFSGKGADFNEWKIKTLALARRKNFAVYLKEDCTRSTTPSDVRLNYEKGNADAWDQLVLSLTGSPFDLIQEADEDAHKAWKILLKKYEVSDEKTESLNEVTKEWHECNLGGVRTDPDNWFSKMYRINQKFKKISTLYEKDDDTMKAHVLANLPDEYKAVRTNLNMNSTYTYEDYKKHIRNYWYGELGGRDLVSHGTSEQQFGDSSENALNTTVGSTGFPFKCRKCGKKGHKAKDCRTPTGERQKFTGNCNWCGKKGHKEAQCFAKKRGEPKTVQNQGNAPPSTNNTESTNTVEDMFAGMTHCVEINEASTERSSEFEEWLGDSGASTHITYSDYGMKNKKKCNVRVTVSTGEATTATVRGDLDMISDRGEKMTLLNVLYVPSVKRNLLSTNKFIQRGAILLANEEKMQIKKDGKTITLPCKQESGGNMYCLNAKRIVSESINDVGTAESTEEPSKEKSLPKTLDINVAHGFCHLGEKLLRVTFNALGVKLTGNLVPCDGCCRANAKAKGVRKWTTTSADSIGERLYVDTSGPYPETESGSKYWICIVDDKTRKSWSKFRKTKSEMPKIVDEHIEYLKGLGHVVKYIRCDNAGEHQEKLRKVCEKWGIELEYMAPYTPQMNGVVERRIAVLLNAARAFLYAANFTEETRRKLWAEAVNYAEDVRNSMATTGSRISANELFFGKKPSFLKNLVEFGRIGYVTRRDVKIKGKLMERAIKCVMVGYARNHTGDTYRMYNPGTKRIILSRDVTWGDWNRTDPRKNMDIYVTYDSTDTVPGVDEVIVDVKNLGEKESMDVQSLPDDYSGEKFKIVKNEKIEPKSETTKLERELKKLDTSYNPTVSDTEEKPAVRDGNVVVTGDVNPLPIEIPKEETADFAELHNTSVTSDVGDPKSFEDAIGSARGKLWKLSMIAEVNNFLYRKAWIPRKLAEVRDKGRKPIPVKWVFKTKLEPDGSERLKSRIITKGYLQVPEVDFTESFSPVAMDCSTRIIVGVTLYFSVDMGWVCEAFDVEAAFLEPYLDIEMYIGWPVGMVKLGFLTKEEYESTCVQLRRSMYGNVDAALRWQREFSSFLVKECGMTVCRTDPCILFLRTDGVLQIIMSIHVDDSLCAGSKKDLEELYVKIRKRYKITNLGQITKYLGVMYEWGKNENGPYAIASMKKNADEIISYFEKVERNKLK